MTTALRRYPVLIALCVAALFMVVPFLIVLGSPGFAREEVQTILFLTAVAAAISLGIGAWFGRKLEAGQTTVRQRAFALFWPHMVMLAVLGGIAIFFLYAAALSRIH